jgi:hypothetical protein
LEISPFAELTIVVDGEDFLDEETKEEENLHNICFFLLDSEKSSSVKVKKI